MGKNQREIDKLANEGNMLKTLIKLHAQEPEAS
jgi:hypothetical protein